MTTTTTRAVHATCLAALALLAACASSPSGGGVPAWVDSREHPAYPEGAYLIGVGTATDRDRDAAYQKARDRAIADISGQLETHIRSEVTSYVSESLRVENGDSANELLEQASTEVKAVTSGSIKAIRPVEQSYDEATGLAASLVVIKRTDFAFQAQAELDEIDQRVAVLERDAERLLADDKIFQATRRYAEIEPLLVRRAAVEAQAQFVWPARPSSAPALDLGSTFAKRRDAAARVRLVLLCKHDQFGDAGAVAPVEQQFLQPFAAFGVAVTPGSGEDIRRWNDAAYLRETFGTEEGQALLFFCEVSTTKRPAGHGDLIGVRSSGAARLVDASTGELLLTASYSPDAAGDTPAIGSPERIDSLVDRALAHLASKLAGRVLEQL